jgi:hypothetical protein
METSLVINKQDRYSRYELEMRLINKRNKVVPRQSRPYTTFFYLEEDIWLLLRALRAHMT